MLELLLLYCTYSSNQIMHINSKPASGEFWRPLMTFANNLDPDEAPQKVGSKLFDIQIIYQQKKWVETINFLNF